MGADRITLKNLVFYAYHGAFAAEKELGQRFEVDVDMYRDLGACARVDDLDMAISYVDVYTLVKEIVEEREFSLIETLARTIADEVISGYALDEVTVRVRKPHAPIGGPMDYVECEMTRKAPAGDQVEIGGVEDAEL
ncbi:MAG: dihydroneopterin aldolase [Clostridia bacterium]|nr:dihydroneopterin aldolase [Clostridia bacterium]